jgi:hypothetical protein
MYMQYIFSNILIDIIVFWFRMCNMQIFDSIYYKCIALLSLILLTWKIRWAPNNASKCQMGFNLVFKVLMTSLKMTLLGPKHVGGDSQNKLLLMITLAVGVNSV